MYKMFLLFTISQEEDQDPNLLICDKIEVHCEEFRHLKDNYLSVIVDSIEHRMLEEHINLLLEQ